MDKRELKKYPIHLVDRGIVSQAHRIEQVEYYLYARTAQIAHQRILVVSLYSRERVLCEERKPAFRIFMSKKEYITQTFMEERIIWRTGRMEYLIEDHWYRHKKLACCDDQSVSVLNRYFSYLHRETLSPVDKLIAAQNRILEEKLKKRHALEKKEIDYKMQEVKNLPRNFVRWVDEIAMAHSRYIYYQYSRKTYMDGYCTYCHSEVKVRNIKHRTVGICPCCGKQVLFLAEGKAKNISDHGQAAYFQKTSQGFVIRFFYIHKFYGRQYKSPEIRISEMKRIFYEQNQSISYEWRNFKQTGEMYWCKDWDGYLFERAACYTANLDRVLQGTPYQYSALRQFAERYEGAPVNVYGFLWRYMRKPYLEYMIKTGLYHLVEDMTQIWYYNHLFSDSGKNLMEIMGVTKEQFRFIQRKNMTGYEYKIYKKMLEEGIREIPEDFSGFCRQYGYDTHMIIGLMRYTTLHRIERYCKSRETKQQSFDLVMRLWWDYLQFAAKLGYDMKNEFVVFPRHLIQAHDAAAMEVQRRKEKELREKMRQENERAKILLNQYKKVYSWTDGNLSVVVPEDLFSIREEGHCLHHCVATYTTAVAEGRTIILFIRKNSEIDKSFYTMEVKEGRIIQCQGFAHKAQTEEVKEFVRLYERKVLEPLKNTMRAVS